MEKLNNIVVVTGVSASGKDYLVEKAFELGGDVISSSSIFNYRDDFGF
jgi:dephospho-CoA kinase